MGSKILLQNLPVSLDQDTIRLLFENPKYCGKCAVDYDIVELNQYNIDNANNLFVIEYSNKECVQAVLRTGEIRYKDISIRPVAFNDQVIEEFKKNKVKQETRSESKLMRPKHNIIMSTNLDDIIETDTSFIFKHKLSQHLYPFYLLNYNKQIVNDLNENLNQVIKAKLIQNDEGYFVIVASYSKSKFQEPLDINMTFQFWLNQLTSFLHQYMSKRFNQFKLPIQKDRNLFHYLRYKTIDSYVDSDEISLLYNNDPSDFWIRIEGESKLIDIEKIKILKDIEFYNTNKNLLLSS